MKKAMKRNSSTKNSWRYPVKKPSNQNSIGKQYREVNVNANRTDPSVSPNIKSKKVNIKKSKNNGMYQYFG